ncbi:hypothetical protein QBC36DRAFT_318901 [Triangularia setosa]|uniref:Uncharacterized protein n=1 Tax=Triangularia setosa TaxID=2587417 RepID=A0AAN6WFY3_9PEZI|nr:hypothetical protein QBC36DRAFT_318901 [Podospora setosa]
MASPFQTWSPSLLGSNTTKIPRRFVEITKDQEELLNRNDAWHKPHVPALILDKVKASCTETQHRSPAVESPLPATPFRTWSSSLLGDHTTTISHQLLQVPKDQGKFLGRTDAYSSPQIPSKVSDHVRASSRSSRHRPAVAAPSSPTPTPQRTKEPQLAAVVELSLPRSSIDSSGEEPEIQAPKAPIHTDARQPEPQASRIHISPGPTPPPGQVIPSTYPEPPAIGSPPKPKRRRLIKNAAASLNPAEVSMHLTRPSILSLPKRVSPPQPASSSIPPSSSVTASPLAIRPQAVIQQAVPSIVLRGGGLLGSSGSSKRPSPNVPASQDPFNVFKETYPDYDGSLGDFVRGVLSLIPLQKKKTVPQYILDDYIRVFSGDYLEYIEHLRDDQRPLTTWEWYCENVPRPIYMKGVLSSESLKDIRHRYPDKVVAIEAQSTPVHANIWQPNIQQTHTSNTFSTPAPANSGQQNVQQNQVSSPLWGRFSSARPSNIATRSSIHVAELASDPISTAEDPPFETHPRTSNHRSTGAIGPATRFISGLARQSHTQSMRPVSVSTSRLSSSSVRFETQVDFPSLEMESSGNSVWDHGDDAMGPVERQPDEQVVDDQAPCPSLQSSAEGTLEQAAVGIDKSRIGYRLSNENSVGGIKRPWEGIADSEEQQSVQQQCFATFLAGVWGPQHNKGRQVRSVV